MYPLECYISIVLRLCISALRRLHALCDNARLQQSKLICLECPMMISDYRDVAKTSALNRYVRSRS